VRSMRFVPVLLLSLLGIGSGCNGSDCNKLAGAVATTFNLDFSRVDIKKQIKNGVVTAMIVEYVNDNVKGCIDPVTKMDTCPRPVKVVANAPLTAGSEHDLVNDGVIQRIMQDGSQFKDLDTGYIKFNGLSGDIDGEFYGTFEGGLTINGDFCGGVIDVNN